MNSGRTSDLLQEWTRARQSVEHYEQELNRARLELANKTNQFGKFLAPDDAEVGEEFQLWVNTESVGIRGDALIIAVKVSDQEYQVRWRDKRKKIIQAAA